jgi:hypothetical protein
MMPDKQRRCARCDTELELVQFGAYDDGAVVKVFACRFCTYLKVETDWNAGHCDHKWGKHLM